MKRDALRAIVYLATCLSAFPAFPGDEYYGFTAPYREIDIGAPEIGIISEISVRVGDIVTSGQTLARLDSRVLEAALAGAKARAAAHGRITAAQAARDLRQERLSRLERLQDSGSARPDELIIARAELQIAAAELSTRIQEREIERLKQAQIEAQIARRVLTSPIDGTVVKINKEVAERVGNSGDEPIMTVVQLNPLRMEIFAPVDVLLTTNSGDIVEVSLPSIATPIQATVEHIVPTIDPESGTTSVMLTLPNPHHDLYSGIRGTVQFGKQ